MEFVKKNFRYRYEVGRLGICMRISHTKDYELVANLNRYVQDIHTNLFPEIFKEYHELEVRNFFKEMMNKPNMDFLLIKYNEEPVGYIWIEFKDYPESTFKKPYKSVYVHQISVSENHRNKGYGSRLLDEISSIAKTKGINKIEVDYWVDNKDAKDFYEKKNFVKYREVVYKNI